MTGLPEPVVRFEAVARTFHPPAGPLPVLRGVDLELRAGEFAVLAGPSGSGKTTLLHLAALLDAPSAGRIRFDGRDTSGLDDAGRSRLRAEAIGLVFQQFHLLPGRSVLENVLFRFRYAPRPAAEARRRALEALERVGLAERADHPARLLSGGEMQRVAIARAAALPPRLLLADEPTGNLDAGASAGAVELLRGFAASGAAVLLATHNPALAAGAARVWDCGGGTVRPRGGGP
jgi:ABC-type lipoprotein export system ATPase subunit